MREDKVFAVDLVGGLKIITLVNGGMITVPNAPGCAEVTEGEKVHVHLNVYPNGYSEVINISPAGETEADDTNEA